MTTVRDLIIIIDAIDGEYYDDTELVIRGPGGELLEIEDFMLKNRSGKPTIYLQPGAIKK